MLVDLAQTAHAQTSAKLVQHAHIGHLALAPQASKLSPGTLLRQHLNQQIQRAYWRKQTQQMHTKKLGRSMHSMPSTRGSMRPPAIDEIVRHEGIQDFEQRGRPGRRQVGVHASRLVLES